MSTEALQKRGGRRSRRAERTQQPLRFLPGLKRNIPYFEILDDAQIQRIHEASLKILSQTGCDFRDPIAIEHWREAGATINGENVRLDPALVTELIKTIPNTIHYTARNPERNVSIGHDQAMFIPMAGAPYVKDLEGKRRYSTLEDLNHFHQLSHMSPALHSSGHVICEPMDIPVPYRHLHITYSSLIHSDKTLMGMSTSGSRAKDVLNMAAIVFGEAFMRDNPVITANCNCNSPLVWDETMLAALREYGAMNQPVLCSPFVLAGANTPASVAASVAQLNAEALAGLAYSQLANPGTPVIYGHYLSTVSMKSGAPMAGTPEITLMNAMVGQMARFYDVPWRSSASLGGAKRFDAQAGYESATTLMATVLSGANYIWHSAGWNEAGLVADMPKFIIDAQQVEMTYRMAKGVDWDDFEDALAAVDKVGPAGHYLGEDHTLEHFQDAFFMPDLFNNDSFEQWQAAGEISFAEWSRQQTRKMLNEYQKPPMDPAVDEALKAYITKRESELDPKALD